MGIDFAFVAISMPARHGGEGSEIEKEEVDIYLPIVSEEPGRIVMAKNCAFGEMMCRFLSMMPRMSYQDIVKNELLHDVDI